MAAADGQDSKLWSNLTQQLWILREHKDTDTTYHYYQRKHTELDGPFVATQLHLAVFQTMSG